MKNILVPTDFSPEAHHAYEVALQLAKHTGGNVTLLYVLEGQEPTETGNFSTFGAPVHGGIVPNSGGGNSGMQGLFVLKLMQATKHRMHILKDEAATLAADVPMQDTVEVADLSDGILRAIQKHGSDLVVMGVQNHGGSENFFLGSHVERTIRLAPCPVLAVKPPQAAFDVRTIVFPSDFSADADSAFAGLQPVLTAFPDATLHLLHVATNGNDEATKQQMQVFAKRHQLTHCQVASINADEVSTGIEQYAQQVQASLVVLPTYHHSGLSSFLHAGIADIVATHALPPVLTYHFTQPGA
ncbi:universal stress protein [Hymenobacter baengnokdamensis]|uniref:universal stress protein n=1 Tax=Hymenobacter baengnokdamensis TaxID=2615203 RepID=UPI001244CA33|nr:universal stress protein [Hymenobacter baengnokdamensis]